MWSIFVTSIIFLRLILHEFFIIISEACNLFEIVIFNLFKLTSIIIVSGEVFIAFVVV